MAQGPFPRPPRLFGLPFEQPADTAQTQPAIKPEAKPKVTPKALSDAEPTLVLRWRKTHRDYTYLRPHQERLAQVTRIAAEQTKHLTGPERVRAMNVLISRLLQERKSR